MINLSLNIIWLAKNRIYCLVALMRFCVYLLKVSDPVKSRHGISFIVQLTILTMITPLNTSNRQRIVCPSVSHSFYCIEWSNMTLEALVVYDHWELSLGKRLLITQQAHDAEYQWWMRAAFNDRAIGQLSPIIIILRTETEK